MAVVGGLGGEPGAEFAGDGRVDVLFARRVQKGVELIELALGDGIVLVIVALGASGGESEPGGGDGVDAIDGAVEAVFGARDAGFAVVERHAVEAGGDALFEGRVGEQVAGDLFDGELIEGQVSVQGVDHPMAIAPGPGTRQVLLEAVGIGIAGQVEPGARPAFAIVGRGEELVDPLFVVGVALVLGDLVAGGRQSAKIERKAAEENERIGFGRGRDLLLGEARADIVVNRMGGGAGGGLGGGDGLEGPVGCRFLRRQINSRPGRKVDAGVDPLFKGRDFSAAEARSGRRHHKAGLPGGQAIEDLGRSGIAGDDRGSGVAALQRELALIEAESIHRLRGAMAGEASLLEDRESLAISRPGGGRKSENYR